MVLSWMYVTVMLKGLQLMNDSDKGRFVEYTEEELLTQYMIRAADAKIKEAQRTKDTYQKSCSHRHVNIEHKRVDDYGTSPEFYSNIRCLVCGKHWTEKGSK